MERVEIWTRCLRALRNTQTAIIVFDKDICSCFQTKAVWKACTLTLNVQVEAVKVVDMYQ